MNQRHAKAGSPTLRLPVRVGDLRIVWIRDVERYDRPAALYRRVHHAAMQSQIDWIGNFPGQCFAEKLEVGLGGQAIHCQSGPRIRCCLRLEHVDQIAAYFDILVEFSIREKESTLDSRIVDVSRVNDDQPAARRRARCACDDDERAAASLCYSTILAIHARGEVDGPDSLRTRGISGE